MSGRLDPPTRCRLQVAHYWNSNKCLDVYVNCRQNFDYLRVRRLAQNVLPTPWNTHVEFVSDAYHNYRTISMVQHLAPSSIRLADRDRFLENNVHGVSVVTVAILLTEAITLWSSDI